MLTGSLSIRNVKASLLKEIVLSKVDPLLFAMSYDDVGDLAETIALIVGAERWNVAFYLWTYPRA